MNKQHPNHRTISQLESTIRVARLELAWQIVAPDPFKAIRGQEHCKRALTVAAVQGHTVGVYGPHGAGKTMIAEAGRAIGVVVVEGIPCPCGNYTDPRSPCRCTPTAIRRHQDGLREEAGACDLHVECPSVPARELLSARHGTTTGHVRDQLAHVGSLPDKTSRGPGCDEILKQVVAELGMSARTVETCLSVAQSVAALAARDTIDVTDILEAVHYRPLDRLLHS